MFYELGAQTAMEKLGGIWDNLMSHGGNALRYLAGRPTLSAALRGAGTGALTGGVMGAMGSDDGHGGAGFMRGALLGGATGAALGGLAGHGRQNLLSQPKTNIPAETLDRIAANRNIGLGYGALAGIPMGVVARKKDDGYLAKLKGMAGLR